MIKLESDRRRQRWILTLATLALVVAAVAPLMLAERVRAQEGEKPVKAWKNIALLYTTDIKGKIEPCG